jgi:hypothetical protein
MPSYCKARPGEVRVVLARVGRVDPDAISTALAAGAYQVFSMALQQDPELVLKAVEPEVANG